MAAALTEADAGRARPPMPPQELWGEGAPARSASASRCCTSIDHASLHLGHLQSRATVALAGVADTPSAWKRSSTKSSSSRRAARFSEMVRLHLESRGQKYTERDVDIDPGARDDMIKLGAQSTPVTVIDGEAIVGFDEEAIDELLGFTPYNAHEELGAGLDEL
jgi:glutaredoxin